MLVRLQLKLYTAAFLFAVAAHSLGCAPRFYGNGGLTLGTVAAIVFLDPQSGYAQVSASNQASTRIFGSCTAGASVRLFPESSTTALATTTCSASGYFETTIDFSSYSEGSISIRGLQTVGGVNSSSWATLVMNKSTTFCSNAANRLPGAFPAGTGTAGDPYLICTAAQATLLIGVPAECSTAGLFFKLADDLDLSGYPNWTSLCIGGAGLVGTFDGDSYHVDDLQGDTYGLFGTVATIKDVYFRDVNVVNTISSASSAAGSLAGSATRVRARGSIASNTFTGGGLFASAPGAGVSISDSFFIGTVSTAGSCGGVLGESNGGSGTISNVWADAALSLTGGTRCGGLVGRLGAFTVTSSYARGTINVSAGASGAGGLVGSVSGASTITSSYSTVNVTAVDSGSFSALVGGLDNSNLNLVNVYATGRVTTAGGNGNGGLVGTLVGALLLNITTSRYEGMISAGTADYVGGLVGFLSAGPTAVITDSYSNATVTAADEVAGLVGADWGGTLTINTSYSNSTVTGTSVVNGVSQGGTINNVYYNSTRTPASTTGTALTNAQMQSSANFTGFTFDATHWVMGTYPMLYWE